MTPRYGYSVTIGDRMKDKIRVTLSEEASSILLFMMERLKIDSPTHCLNVILTSLPKPKALREDINEGKYPSNS